MREHFRDIRPGIITPRLPGISAFGNRLAFYEYDATDNVVNPPAIMPADPNRLGKDVAPASRWNYDLLQPEGIAQMRKVVEDVKAMCESLSP